MIRPGRAQADTLGLGDGGELALPLGSDLDGVPSSRFSEIIPRLHTIFARRSDFH
jgi:hypothetical protein